MNIGDITVNAFFDDLGGIEKYGGKWKYNERNVHSNVAWAINNVIGKSVYADEYYIFINVLLMHTGLEMEDFYHPAINNAARNRRLNTAATQIFALKKYKNDNNDYTKINLKKYLKLLKAELENKQTDKIWNIRNLLIEEYVQDGETINYKVEKSIIENILDEFCKISFDCLNGTKASMSVIDCVRVLEKSRQIILQGPPGTGKTRLAKIVAAQMVAPNDMLNQEIANLRQIEKKADAQKNIIKIEEELEQRADRILDDELLDKELLLKGCINIVQFHPSYGYEDFVMGIGISTKNDTLNYINKPGAIKRLAEIANDDKNKSKKYVLIIDEINRASLSTVMGELLYALENRGNADVKILPFEGAESYKLDNTSLIIPDNLYIIGTMNTADRSISSMDYAMRRRFAFIDINSVPPNNKEQFNEKLYKNVDLLFQPAYIVTGINPDDIKLGVSYFICPNFVWDKSKKEMQMGISRDNTSEWKSFFKYKVRYEITPILMEYYKDGYFKKKAKIQELAIEKIFSSVDSVSEFLLNN